MKRFEYGPWALTSLRRNEPSTPEGIPIIRNGAKPFGQLAVLSTHKILFNEVWDGESIERPGVCLARQKG
jgi:hypothetical protein